MVAAGERIDYRETKHFPFHEVPHAKTFLYGHVDRPLRSLVVHCDSRSCAGRGARDAGGGSGKDGQGLRVRFRSRDSTRALQAAINSGAAKVIVDNLGKPWIVDPITLGGDQELFFEKGTEVLAKKGSFKGTGDSLFRAVSSGTSR